VNLSPSKVYQWRTCRLAWWFRYVARAVPPNVEPWHLTRGTAAHAGLAMAYSLAANQVSAARTHGRRMSDYEPEALEAFYDALGPHANHPDRIWAAGALIELLATLPVPAPLSIIAVERPFQFDTAGGRVEGVLDLAFRTGPDSLHIRDWKWSKTPEADGPQGVTYSIAGPLLFPWAKRVSIGFYSITHRTEDPMPLDEAVLNQGLEDLEYAGLEMADAIEAAQKNDVDPSKIFAPTLGEHCGSCVFRAYCPAYGGPPAELTYPIDDVVSTRADLLKRLEPTK